MGEMTVTTPTCEFIELDPDLCDMLLQANDFYQPGVSGTNRKLSQKKIDTYCEAMLRGEWLLSDHGISIGEDGRLKNGQKRLMAFKQACRIADERGLDRPQVKILFVQNLPAESMAVLDTGEVRTAANFLQIKFGLRNAGAMAAAARLLWIYDNIPYAPGAWTERKLTNQQLEESLHKGGVELEEAVNRGKQLRIMGTAAASVGYYLCHRDLPEQRGMHLDFYHGLQVGTGLYPSNPILALRRFYENRGDKGNRVEGLALYIRAFSAYAAGARIDTLSFRSGTEGFPRVGEITARMKTQLNQQGPGYWITNELERNKAENNA